MQIGPTGHAGREPDRLGALARAEQRERRQRLRPDGAAGGHAVLALSVHQQVHRFPGNAEVVVDRHRPDALHRKQPLLQLDARLIDACHRRGFEVAVETNGTVEPPPGIDWLTVSPKPRSELVVRRGQELKLVFPHAVTPESVADLDFEVFFLQPMDGPHRAANLARAAAYCQRHPRWRLSLQTLKIAGLP